MWRPAQCRGIEVGNATADRVDYAAGGGFTGQRPDRATDTIDREVVDQVLAAAVLLHDRPRRRRRDDRQPDSPFR